MIRHARPITLTVVIAGTSLLAAHHAAAQVQNARWYIAADGGFQTTQVADIIKEPITFEQFAEEGQLRRPFDIDRMPAIAAHVGVRLWRNFGIRLGISQFIRNDNVDLSVDMPHPFFFNRHRTFSQSSTLRQRERTVDLHALWLTRIGDRVNLQVFGGPTLYRVSIDVAGVQAREEQYPFEASPVIGVATFQRRPSPWGYTVGTDMSVFVSRHVGVGWMVQFSRASATIQTSPDGLLHDADRAPGDDARGVRWHAGLRRPALAFLGRGS